MRPPVIALSVAVHAAVLLGALALGTAEPAPPIAVRWQPSEASTAAPGEPVVEPPAVVPEPPLPAPDLEVHAEPESPAAFPPPAAEPAPFAPDAAQAAAALRARAVMPSPLARIRAPAPRSTPVAASTPSIVAPAADAATSAPAAVDVPTPAAAAPAAFVAAVADASRNVPPGYPEEARRRGEQGTVLIELEIDALGRVSAARVLRSSGHRRLDREALRALRAWRFEPARRGGVAVPTRLERPVVFSLLTANG